MKNCIVAVASYNVLSSHLCSADWFSSCNPIYLDQAYRLSKLKEILAFHIAKQSIICLQEVSRLWLDDLQPFFKERGYSLVSGMYGVKFNGYMGVVTAVPMSRYEVVGVEVTRVADTKSLPVMSIAQYVYHILAGILFTRRRNLFNALNEDDWTASLVRQNQVIALRLQTHEGKRFVVGNYHMPCEFKKPQLMMIHASLSLQYLQKYAGSDPLIYCGDFNMKPDSPMYKLVTTAEIDAKDPSTPVPHFVGDKWQCNDLSPMRSAYAVSGGEPEFTNFSKVKDEPEFVGTLDYIFLSRQWEVLSVQELELLVEMKRITGGSPLPHRNHPSDHLLIAADLQL